MTPPTMLPSSQLTNTSLPKCLQRSKSTLTGAALQSRRSAYDTEEEEATKSLRFDYRREHSHINLVNNIVDLNVISSSSKLSGHFLSCYEGKRRLADLNLNEIWPASTMYKVGIYLVQAHIFISSKQYF